jgi:hypothetical protein
LAAAVLWTSVAGAAPGTLYADKHREGPVRGEAGELLLLPGSGLATTSTVVFRRFDGVQPPLDIPASDSAAFFKCTSQSAFCKIKQKDEPGVVVALPASYGSGHRYMAFAVNSVGEKSNATVIGDARPLWVSPGFIHATSGRVGLEREIRIVGRNLDRAGRARTHVRLMACNSGVQNPFIFLDAEIDSSPTGKYVARVDLAGSTIPVGTYAVAVKRGTVDDYVGQGCSTTDPEDMLEVRPAPPAAWTVTVGCVPNDGADDTACIVQAIQLAKSAAGAAGLADVVFPPGTYDLLNAPVGGIYLPARVGLRAQSTGTAKLSKHATWNAEGASACPVVCPGPPDVPCCEGPTTGHPWCDGVRDGRPVFRLAPDPAQVLVAHNTIRGLVFEDLSTQPGQPFGHSEFESTTFFSIESPPDSGGNPTKMREVTFTDNTFVNTGVGVYTKGWVEDFVFTHNDVTADGTGLLFGPVGELALNAGWTHEQARDVTIRQNTFRPGRYNSVAAHQGSFPMALGGATRIDVSDNDALNEDGDPLTTDETGYRAGLFFHQSNNVEKALVSNNVFECTGSKAGDGEGIALDSNQNRMPFRNAKAVSSAGASSVTVDVTTDGFSKPSSFFKEHWVRVGAGKGMGQVRKVTGIKLMPGPVGTGVMHASFTVSPPWEVVPAGSTVMFSRQYWQTLIVGNTIDNEGCPLNDDSTRYQTGDIGLGTTSDSVVEGNLQIATEGIGLFPAYGVQNDLDCRWPYADPTTTYFVDIVSFFNVEIRGNTIEGEGLPESYASYGGIAVIATNEVVGANCVPTPPPPGQTPCNQSTVENVEACDPQPIPVTTVFGLNIVKNHVSQADTRHGSVIALSRFYEGWADPVGSKPWAILPLVHRNELLDLPFGDLHGTSTIPYTFAYETGVKLSCDPFDTTPTTAGFEETVRGRMVGIGANRFDLATCATADHVPIRKAVQFANDGDATELQVWTDCSTQ